MPVKFKNQWYIEAIENLGQYNMDPFLYDFMDMFKIPYTYSQTRNVLLHRIKKRLKLKKAPSLFDLTKYLDELKFCGKQHIFLYKLPNEQQHYLEKLRNRDFILKQLRKKRLGKRLEDDEIFKWESNKPELVEVQHSYNNIQYEDYLKFKWVETRRYSKYEPSSPNNPPRLVPKKERSVNFFIINLQDGLAELRIQSIKPRPYKKNNIVNELNRYKKIINGIIDFKLFSPFLLESVIKTFLVEPILTITGWSSQNPVGMKVGKDTFFLKKFILSSKKILSKELSASWNVSQKSHGRQQFNFTINGKLDAILFNAVSDKSKVDFTINQLKKLSQPNIENIKLDQLSKKYPKYTRIIQNIDYHLTKLDTPNINTNQIAKDIVYPKQQIKKVFHIIANEISKTFYIKTTNKNELYIYNRFNFKGGLLEYFRRRAYNTKWEKWIEPIFTITGTIGSISSYPFVNNLIQYLLKQYLDIIMPPYISYALVFLCFTLIILLQFGIVPLELIQKLGKMIGITVKRTGTGSNEIAIQKSFDREYKEYLSNLPKSNVLEDELKLLANRKNV